MQVEQLKGKQKPVTMPRGLTGLTPARLGKTLYEVSALSLSIKTKNAQEGSNGPKSECAAQRDWPAPSGIRSRGFGVNTTVGVGAFVFR